MKTIVIGAGAAGLAAVHSLKKAGVDVICLESSSRPAGRTYTAHRDGYILDYGAQFFSNPCRTYFDLVKEMGLQKDLTRIAPVMGMPRREDNTLSAACLSLNPLDLWKVRKEVIKFRAIPFKAIRQMLPVATLMLRRKNDWNFEEFERLLDLDDRSLADFVLEGAGQDALEYVLQPVASSLTLAEPEDISAAYGLALLWYNLTSSWTLKQGFGTVSQKLYEQNRQAVRLSTPVKRVVIEDRAVKGVETEGGFIDADHIICATTAPSALGLMPDLPDGLRKPLEQVKYSACAHVIFALRERLLPKGWYGVTIPRQFGSPMSAFSESSVKSSNYAPEGAGLVSCFTFSHHARKLNAMRDQDVISVVARDIKRWVPDMPDEYVFTEICRLDEAVCSAPAGMLKAVSHMKKNHAGDVQGLHLAGEYLYMPSVDGATLSGMDAAQAVMQAM